MVGFGHIRRNASIAQALSRSSLQPVIVLIAEARQAGSLPMPGRVDWVTLPALRKEAGGWCKPRHLDLSNQDLVALRARVIKSAIRAFEPDALIVDHLPRGAAGELRRTLARLRRHGRTRCVLGLRDVLQDPGSVRKSLCDADTVEAIRDYYDAVWVYGDPSVYDLVRECRLPESVASKVRYTGYLDQRSRLEYAALEGAPLPLGPGRFALCVVGGGQDGTALAEAFIRAERPADMEGVVVTGPYMAVKSRQRLRRLAARQPGLRLVEFLPEPAPLLERADRVIAMGGYNTICEVLSFEKHALIVPRVSPKPEQWIRAARLRELGLVELLHPDRLHPGAIREWLARDLGPSPDSRRRVDLGGLDRIPGMLAALLEHPPAPRRAAAMTPVSRLEPARSVP